MINRFTSAVIPACVIRYHQVLETPEIVTRYVMLAITIILLTLSPPTTISNAGTANMLDEAVAIARAGNSRDAIQILLPIYEQEPTNSKVYNDLIVILCWNNELTKACTIFEQYEASTFPEYVLKTVKKAYLRLNQKDKAEKIAKVLITV